MQKKATVIGIGRLGLCFALTLEKAGYNVCGCDINVDYSFGSGFVEKEGDRLYFVSDALMYAAIFADSEVYECQLERLMQRAGELSLIYRDKSNLVEEKDCSLEMNADLTEFSNLVEIFESSSEIIGFVSIIEDLDDENYAAGVCGLW